MKRSIVLLSGGLDSAVCLAQAMLKSEVVCALTFNYGQKAAAKECESSKKLCAHYKINHHIIELPFLQSITRTALVNSAVTVPRLVEDQLDDQEYCQQTAQKVWVPNRNGLFINIAASYAESYSADFIVAGFNREEATTFPDNSKAFVEAINQSLSFSTLKEVELLSYTIDLDKVEIVKLGKALGLPFQHIWSCYFGGKEPCGNCESCQRLDRALRKAGVKQC